MYFLTPNVTSVYTIGERISLKVLDLINPHSEVDILWMFMIHELMICFNNYICYYIYYSNISCF